MRAILILAVVLSCCVGAEPARESFVLTDGRSFVGTYDEESQMLTLDGGKASLKIAPEMIAERSPAKAVDVLGNESTPSATETVKSMTPEEKAAAMAKYEAAQKAAAKKKALADADKMDQQADAVEKEMKYKIDHQRREGSKKEADAIQELQAKGRALRAKAKELRASAMAE